MTLHTKLRQLTSTALCPWPLKTDILYWIKGPTIHTNACTHTHTTKTIPQEWAHDLMYFTTQKVLTWQSNGLAWWRYSGSTSSEVILCWDGIYRKSTIVYDIVSPISRIHGLRTQGVEAGVACSLSLPKTQGRNVVSQPRNFEPCV